MASCPAAHHYFSHSSQISVTHYRTIDILRPIQNGRRSQTKFSINFVLWKLLYWFQFSPFLNFKLAIGQRWFRQVFIWPNSDLFHSRHQWESRQLNESGIERNKAISKMLQRFFFSFYNFYIKTGPSRVENTHGHSCILLVFATCSPLLRAWIKFHPSMDK